MPWYRRIVSSVSRRRFICSRASTRKYGALLSDCTSEGVASSPFSKVPCQTFICSLHSRRRWTRFGASLRKCEGLSEWSPFARESLLVDKIIASNDEGRRGRRILSYGILISYSQRIWWYRITYLIILSLWALLGYRLNGIYIVIKPPRFEFEPPSIKSSLYSFLNRNHLPLFELSLSLWYYL